MYYFIPTENQLPQEARPPPDADFYDAFQKLKHALNLLVSFTWDIIHDCFVSPAYRTFPCPLLMCISFSVMCITADIKEKIGNHTTTQIVQITLINGIFLFKNQRWFWGLVFIPHAVDAQIRSRTKKKLNKIVGSGTSKELPS